MTVESLPGFVGWIEDAEALREGDRALFSELVEMPCSDRLVSMYDGFDV